MQSAAWPLSRQWQISMLEAAENAARGAIAVSHETAVSCHFCTNATGLRIANTATCPYAACMPSMLHELLVKLFRNRPELVADLLRASFGAELPPFDEARVGSSEFTDLKPAQYHADLVVLLAGRSIEHGVIVEVQLSTDDRKRYTWPVYVYSLRAQLSCPVSLVVVTPDERVARWAEERVKTGINNDFAPLVVHPSVVPQIVSELQARDDPSLAALSAIMHLGGRDTRTGAAVYVAAQSALPGLPGDLSPLYFDLFQTLLSDAIRQELQSMDISKYEFQSDFAKHYIALGREEGRTTVILRQLALRFGPLTEEMQARIRQASIDELDLLCERVLTASTLDRVLEAHGIEAQ